MNEYCFLSLVLEFSFYDLEKLLKSIGIRSVLKIRVCVVFVAHTPILKGWGTRTIEIIQHSLMYVCSQSLEI
jgi:hypothetical protein